VKQRRSPIPGRYTNGWILEGVGLIQDTNLLDEDVFQHALHAGTRGIWGMFPQEIFKKYMLNTAI